jgi:hypothetical protein
VAQPLQGAPVIRPSQDETSASRVVVALASAARSGAEPEKVTDQSRSAASAFPTLPQLRLYPRGGSDEAAQAPCDAAGKVPDVALPPCEQELIGRIRRLFFAEHWKVGTIATDLGLHHDTVEKALYGGPRPVPPPRPSALDPYIEFMRKTLEEHPRLTATRLYRMLRERGYKGSARQVRRRVTEIRPRRCAEAFLRRRTFPGEEGQTDWGSRPTGAASDAYPLDAPDARCPVS